MLFVIFSKYLHTVEGGCIHTDLVSGYIGVCRYCNLTPCSSFSRALVLLIQETKARRKKFPAVGTQSHMAETFRSTFFAISVEDTDL